MMNVFSICAAKDNLLRLIRRAEHGEVIIITRHGKPVAQICALPPELRTQKDESLDDVFNEVLCPSYLRDILRS
jgi:antitoxin (DNA-binding transcriptional repressor) of toxin-antitoxin stability system